jgi:DNA-binding HxlR family transcriptional regulator
MVGDAWSLLIIRDIVYFGKKTYGEFLTSDEGIARNILANRLTQLEGNGILAKKPHPSDGRKEIYELTDKGLGLIPILMHMAEWGSEHYAESGAPKSWIDLVRSDREGMAKLIRETVKEGGTVFVGPNSVIEKLNKRPD